MNRPFTFALLLIATTIADASAQSVMTGYSPAGRESQRRMEAEAITRPSQDSAAAFAKILSREAHVAGTPAQARTRDFVIDKMKYAPVPPLKVGDTLVFVNRDMFRHTVTATNNRFNLDLMPGARGSLHINSAGQTSFTCKYHPGMRGSIIAR